MTQPQSGPPRNNEPDSAALPDLEKGGKSPSTIPGRFKPTSDDDACFKLWNTYISQAQDYDRVLLEGWKGDMDGMLLFSALYSASLTALIIESYKTLKVDPADTTAALLATISMQLNGTAPTSEATKPFQPDTSSFICNMLWFLSLALALTCSLLATFVQQWVRDFMHKTTMRPSPVVQARVLAFSYFGLRRFGMHTFVDVIPILLHVSLFFFFGGLVAFLLPINRPLTYLMTGVLVIFMLVYIGLSCIPLFYLDAPYRTPVSDFLWRLGRRLHGFILRYHHLPDDLTLTEAMIEMSLRNCAVRDQQCMEYTMKSLTHDTELLPMLEALPEAIITPRGGVRNKNFLLVASLIPSSMPEHSVISRISAFISLSGTSAEPTRREKEMSTCLKALWSLAHLVVQYPTFHKNVPAFWFDRSLLDVLSSSDSSLKDYLISTFAFVRTSRLQSIKRCIDMVGEVLSVPAGSPREKLAEANAIFGCISLDDIHWESATFRRYFLGLHSVLQDSSKPNMSATLDRLLDQAKKIVIELQRPARWKAALMSILAEFLFKAVRAEVIPFEMDLTSRLICSSILLDHFELFDPSLDVEEDEAEASYILQHDHFLSSSISPEIYILVIRLFFSTGRYSSFPGYARCRKNVQVYISFSPVNQKRLVVQLDKTNLLEKCVLQDLIDDNPEAPERCVTSVGSLYLGMDIHRSFVPTRLYTFAKQLFSLMQTASNKFTVTRLWKSLTVDTEWILCKHMCKKLEASMSNDGVPYDNDTLESQPFFDDIRTVGQRLLPELTLPERATVPDHMQWIEEIRAYVMSINLLLVAEIVNCSTVGIPFLDWTSLDDLMLGYHGHINSTAQRHFADSVSKLVSLRPWSDLNESAASDVFNRQIWHLNATWSWITDLKSAQILLEAIELHKNDPANFQGFIWMEQDLLERCQVVVASSKDTGT